VSGWQLPSCKSRLQLPGQTPAGTTMHSFVCRDEFAVDLYFATRLKINTVCTKSVSLGCFCYFTSGVRFWISYTRFCDSYTCFDLRTTFLNSVHPFYDFRTDRGWHDFRQPCRSPLLVAKTVPFVPGQWQLEPRIVPVDSPCVSLSRDRASRARAPACDCTCEEAARMHAYTHRGSDSTRVPAAGRSTPIFGKHRSDLAIKTDRAITGAKFETACHQLAKWIFL
jgi:hypothetical protein